MATTADHPAPAPLVSMTVDELNAAVEKVIAVLSDDLSWEWIDDCEDRGLVKREIEHDGDENETALALAFWDAARAIIRDLIAHGDQVHLARTPEED
jgi:hypothetical protein